MVGLLFRGSSVKKALMAMLCFGLAYFAFMAEQKAAAEREAARLAGVPPAVSLNAFDPKADVHSYDEVNVIGWINTDFNYELVQQRKKNGIATGKTTKRMFVLLGPDDSADSRRARAAVVIDPSVVDAFLAEMVANMEGAGPDGLIFRLNGRRTTPVLKSMADDAMAEAGLEKAENFSFIVPWLGQRDARLAPKTGQMPLLPAGFVAGGVLYLLLAGLAFRGRGKSRHAPAPRQGKTMASVAHHVTSPTPHAGFPSPSNLGPFAASSPPAVPVVAAKGHTPRWLLPAFALIALAVLGYQFGGGWVTGLVMLGISVFGAVQAKRVLNTGLAGALGALTAGKPAQDGAVLVQADAPIRSTPSVAAQVGDALNGKGAGGFKLLPLALGVGIMAVSGVFFGQLDKMPLLSVPSEMNSRAADTAPAKVTAPAVTPNTRASASAILADTAPTPPAASLTPDVPTPSMIEPVAAQTAEVDALALPDETGSGIALPLVFVQSVVALVVLVASALVWRHLHKSRGNRGSLGDGEIWARLDRMVAAERARS